MSDLHIRIRAPQGGAPQADTPQADTPQAVTCLVEARLDNGGSFAGEATFDVRALLPLEADPVRYGRSLGTALFAAPGLQRAYRRAEARPPVRIRLSVDSAEIAALRWERLMLDTDTDNGERPVAASPQTPFSRYIELEEPPTSSTDVPRLLLAIANPTGLKNLAPIDVENEVDNLLDAWTALLTEGNLRLVLLTGHTPLSQEMKERIQALGPSCRLAEKSTTLDTLASELQKADGLHLIAHGNLRDGKAMLFLEKEDGSLAVVEEEALRVKFRQPQLRFAFLHSCRGSGGNAGLGPRLVEFGVPAVVAMQEFVPMGDARRFAAAFYAALIQDGAVDIAANKGRQAIFRSQIGNWWIPVLFCRLKDGQVWKPDPVRAAIQKLAKEFQAQPSVQKPFPLDAVLMRRGVARLQHGTAAASGPKLDLIAGSRQALESHETPRPFVLLLGARGGAKSSHLRYLFAHAASSCGPDSDAPLPHAASSCGPDSEPRCPTPRRAAARIATPRSTPRRVELRPG